MLANWQLNPNVFNRFLARKVWYLYLFITAISPLQFVYKTISIRTRFQIENISKQWFPIFDLHYSFKGVCGFKFYISQLSCINFTVNYFMPVIFQQQEMHFMWEKRLFDWFNPFVIFDSKTLFRNLQDESYVFLKFSED